MGPLLRGNSSVGLFGESGRGGSKDGKEREERKRGRADRFWDVGFEQTV